ncbi:MAG: hypothetical protein ABIG32_03510 [Candidatus Uhrbacteria bacterium]|nr:hypothetical protein [Patescibacteria group bacterium]MBU1907396.1 hypothetical protein [Patescibacteria group bacterium]
MADKVDLGHCRVTKLEKLHGQLPPLKPADIVLIRNKHSFFRKFLRRITNSYWDHTALIIYPRGSYAICFSVIVESIRPGLFSFLSSRGVVLHRLDKYLDNPKKFDVGIKRVPDLTDEERKQVRTFMLTNVDAPYWPWHYIQIMLGSYLPFIRKRILNRQRFSCSSLIQKAFYDAMDQDHKKKVVFKEGVWSPIELQELTNPGDIGKSKNCEWIYNEH